MTAPTAEQLAMNDPEGSIFLPKTDQPEREFQRWYFELLMGRGIARDMSGEEILEKYEELKKIRDQKIRDQVLGGTALRSV